MALILMGALGVTGRAPWQPASRPPREGCGERIATSCRPRQRIGCELAHTKTFRKKIYTYVPAKSVFDGGTGTLPDNEGQIRFCLRFRIRAELMPGSYPMAVLRSARAAGRRELVEWRA